jgi:hypothetical protein
MTRVSVMVVGVCFFLCASSVDGSEEVTYTILGVGTTSCAQWTKERHEQQGRLRGLQVLVKVSWIQGFITAMQGHTVSNGGPDIMRKADTDALLSWLDGFCERNAFASLATACLNLVTELFDREQAR